MRKLPWRREQRRSLVVRRTNSLGDVLAATGIANNLIEQGHNVLFEADSRTHPILRRHTTIKKFAPVSSAAPAVDLDGAYENDPQRSRKHVAQMYAEVANKQLAPIGLKVPVLTNFAPRIQCFEDDVLPWIDVLNKYPRPWVMIAPRSNSWPNKTVPDATWLAAAKNINGTCFWTGNVTEMPKPMIDLKIRNIDDLINVIACSDLCVSVDTGPMHIAAALDIPLIAVKQSNDPACQLSDQRDFVTIHPELECINCQFLKCPIADIPPCRDIQPHDITFPVNRRLNHHDTAVSAVIAVYKPDVNRLNRCIEHLIGRFVQVDEVIVAADLDTPWPIAGLTRDPRIKAVRKHLPNIGYGRKQNFGIRHSTGEFILQINDDVFLSDGAVKTMLDVMKDETVGAVSHTLRYPNGKIQYAGKFRSPGAKGFGHLDHMKSKSRFSAPVEQESMCGASVIVRRSAFYEVDGFDERYYLYSDDDDLAMKLRKAGYRIVFTPHAHGIHEEHSTTKLNNNLSEVVRVSNRIFAEKWGWYFGKNPNPNEIGTF